MWCYILLLFLKVYIVHSQNKSIESEEQLAKSWYNETQDQWILLKKYEISEWNYRTNMTKETKMQWKVALDKYAEEYEKLTVRWKGLRYTDKYKDAHFKRHIKELREGGLSPDKQSEFNQILVDLTYEEDDQLKSLNKKPWMLAERWRRWMDKKSSSKRGLFKRYLELKSEEAQLKGFKSPAEEWLIMYNDTAIPVFEEQLEDMIQQTLPLYQQLHGYVRFKLRNKYGDAVINRTGPIPLHLVGYYTGEVFKSKVLTPYAGKSLSKDIRSWMVLQNFTSRTIYEIVDDFYQSLNMTRVPAQFWSTSIFEEPTDRRIDCEPISWRFYEKDNVRVTQCDGNSLDDIITAHELMGHVQYKLQYQHQPPFDQTVPNPGFSYAVGGMTYLSFSTTKHLARMGLLESTDYDKERTINKLMDEALYNLVILNYGYATDKFRIELFRGQATIKDNCRYWELREQYGGVEPPVERSNNVFDVLSTPQVSEDIEMLQSLTGIIFKYQFYEALCKKADQYVPGDKERTLQGCDIYGSLKAGSALKRMMELGKTKLWPDALEVLTGQRKMDIRPMLEYFEPLRVWLEKFNRDNNVYIGWDRSDKCHPVREDAP